MDLLFWNSAAGGVSLSRATPLRDGKKYFGSERKKKHVSETIVARIMALLKVKKG